MADPTIIAAGTRVNGRVEGDQDVAVEGVIDGEIALSETLTVAEPGLVRADVEAREALISGALEGQVRATERIVLTASARVVGTLDAPAIRIEDGASFSGEVIMDLEGAARSSSSSASSASKRTSSSSTATTGSTTTASSTSSRSTTSRSTSASSPSSPAASQSSTKTTTVVEEQEEEEPEPEEASAKDQDVSDDEEPDFAEMPTDEVRDFTVKELREELRERDLPVSGTKDELIERLREDDEG
ncbi:MAG: polymer-forming cytoskeletal protein [Myxococcota bacterium]